MDSEETTEMDIEPTAHETAEGNGGGSEGGGGGVGRSTGGFNNTTEFKVNNNEVFITCHATRVVHVNQATTDEYLIFNAGRHIDEKTLHTKIPLEFFIYDDFHQQVMTPWFLVDSNAWGVWMSPKDFQQMKLLCSEIELVSLEQEIDNVTIKTVTESNQGNALVKQYNNDLTASLQVALDSNNIMPYTPAAPLGETLGFVPWRATKPTQYRYYHPCYIYNRYPNIYKDLEQVTQAKQADYFAIDQDYFNFITLENNIPINILRTGDNFHTGKYEFKSKPCKLTMSYQSTRCLGLPPLCKPIETKKLVTSLENGGELDCYIVGTEFSRMGHFWGEEKAKKNTEINRVRPYNIGYQFPEWVVPAGLQGSYFTGGPRQWSDTTKGAGTHKLQVQQNFPTRYVFDRNHGGDNETDVLDCIPPQEKSNYYSKEELNQHSMNRVKSGAPTHTKSDSWEEEGWPAASCTHFEDEVLYFDYFNYTGETTVDFPQEIIADGQQLKKTLNAYQPTVGQDDVGPVYPWGQIWDKKPDTDHKPSMNYNAPFVCKNNPPGQLFVKLTENLTDIFNFDESPDRIKTYGYFTWRGKLTLKGKISQQTCWNPVKRERIGEPNVFSKDNYHKQIPNNKGNFEIGMQYGRSTVKYIY
ncbi:putative structural protein [sabeidhel virus 1]|uniref:Structural protein n=1 Tax=sabeidhel virus 1 TaxID=2992925 RepID=A0A9E7VB58_9VIRU|nr:putative structural protein [sabeidhel virus 1]